MMVWGEILLKKKKREKKKEKRKKREKKKENLLKIEYGFGYGLTHGLSVLFFFPFIENNIFSFSLFF